MATFAERMKQLRAEHKMNQQELADKLKISRSSVGMYEQGKREPDFEVLDQIADIFDVDLSYLLGKSDVRGAYPRHGRKIEGPLTPEEMTLLEAYRYSSEERKDLVLYVLGISR